MRLQQIPALALALVFLPGWESLGVGQDFRALVQQAAKSSREGLHSGSGAGVYRSYDPAGKMVREVPFQLAFSGKMYNYKLTPKGGRFPRRVLVSDASAIFARDYPERTPKLPPVDVYKSNCFDTAAELLRIDLAHFTAGVLRPEQLDKYPVNIEQLAGGRVRGTYHYPNGATTEFEASPDVAYNVTHMESYETVPAGHAGWAGDLHWARDGAVWYVRKSSVWGIARGGTLDRQEWVFDTFRANPNLSPELFSLEVFNLKAGDFVVDRRSGMMKVHPVDPAALAERKLDSMVRQMEQLPDRRTAPAPVRRPRAALILAANAAVLAIVVLSAWYVRRRHARKAARAQSSG
ncbi:MAG: hypothetical protein ACLQNE_15320 [Thermoguttaceae bacterium]